MACPAVSRG